MAESKIEWCEYTFNPWEGCEKVSPGCKFCYAENRDKRYHSGTNWGPIGQADRLPHSENYWSQPAKWQKWAAESGGFSRVFCGSLCDILELDKRICPKCGQGTTQRNFCVYCDEDVRNESWVIGMDAIRERVWEAVAASPNLLWLFCTKRPENAHRVFPASWRLQWPANAMLGFTAENEEWMRKRRAAWNSNNFHFKGLKTFVSLEPLLGPIPRMYFEPTSLTGDRFDWAIAGGESGDNARPAQVGWFRGIRDTCNDMGIPFLFKQWGEWGTQIPMDAAALSAPPKITTCDHGLPLFKIGKKRAGRVLEGIEHNGIPDYGIWRLPIIQPKPKKRNPLEVLA